MAGVAEAAAAGPAVLSIACGGQAPGGLNLQRSEGRDGGPAADVLGADGAAEALVVVGEPINQGCGIVVEIDLIDAAQVVGEAADHLHRGGETPGKAKCAGFGFGEDHRFTGGNHTKPAQILGTGLAAVVIETPAAEVNREAAEIGEFDEFTTIALVEILADLNGPGSLVVIADRHGLAGGSASGVGGAGGQADQHRFRGFDQVVGQGRKQQFHGFGAGGNREQVAAEVGGGRERREAVVAVAHGRAR